ncbi:YciI family protein [Microlunatus soli]|uniref:Uncharacterized conserved protein n=1 Tax=Microlunatus soli TaxID=630515 RepID=A0A1H1PP72_9ACTN|nr:YciI family protein [Microlunatus soli]SDS13102.1 Uncharacterized conserved protein [Microlunatus soli]
MAQYAILLYADAVAGTGEEHDQHARDLQQAGVMVAAFALQSAETATTVSGDTVTDGPFVDAKEVIAGICIVEAADLDAALEIARNNPSARYGGSVEVRPVEGGVVVDRSV